MKILVVGGGGREHALAWKIAKSPKVQMVYIAPGNGGTAQNSSHLNGITNIAISGIKELAEFAVQEQILLTVVGSEVPLAAGIVNHFRSLGLKIFGPTQEAAQLESSKDFAKQFMKRHNIPTAKFETFTDANLAHQYIDKEGAPIVIKADGLAAGKGVVVAMSLIEAHTAVDEMLSGNSLGSAGSRVVIEEFVTGEEASFIVMVDGKNILPLATSQDHKRLLDHDQGPNTGGMGAYSPAPIVTPGIHAKVLREIIRPTIQGMEKEGITFTGFLYAGLMIHPSGDVKTLEFNCRMGDPETQPIMARLKTDFVEILIHGVEGRLNDIEPEWDTRVALGVVMAAHNYPQTPQTGDLITGIPAEDEHHVVFHAGTTLKDNQLLTSGGRVLCVVGLDGNLKGAQSRAYAAVDQIKFSSAQYRKDIGHLALKRK